TRPTVRVMTQSLIELSHVSRIFPGAGGGFPALRDVSLTVDRGEFAVIVGQSGSGKSTLLGLLSGIDRPTEGRVRVGDTEVQALSERAMSTWRGRAVGIVFQFFQLLPTLTSAENVMLPMDFCGTWPVSERRDRALALLERLGVMDQADKFPPRLSGGQQQRVAIARALANQPAVLLADEPTGNLDSRTSESILALFRDLAQEGQTVVMVTHEQSALRLASRTITLADGRVMTNHPALPAVHA
ncbi:MAG TPA: ABC transporter ATP-binding protein, partial [Gemmatimonadales bacterium]|nr:ABC transporter ATP-binding protein [Gemmatimonadales bacterium]